MFLLRRAATMAAIRKKGLSSKHNRKLRKRKKLDGRDGRVLNGCVGTAIQLGDRQVIDPRPMRSGCSSRCKHASHLKDGGLCSGHGKQDDWISEDIYKRFTETDSRPLTPEQYSRRTVSIQRSNSVTLEKIRKCVTPEPDTKQCQFHNRRVLILDLRRVKSVDAITRQNSITTGESVDSTYGDYDYDNQSSSLLRDSSSVFPHSTPRNFSVSRSTSPKGSGSAKQKGRARKSRERAGSPLVYERSSSPKILEGLTLPPLHQSVLTLLGQKSGVKASPRNHVLHELGSAMDSASSQKAKKLRRHGRRKKVKDEEGKESEEKEIEKPETVTEGRGDTEELQETQLNTQENGDENEDGEDSGAEGEKTPAYLKEIKSLRDVLDDHLCKQRWSQKEMERLNEEIERLSLGLKKYQTEFQAKSISISEDSWLAFPRTCAHATATFGVPTSYRVLKDLTPVVYLRNYVSITEPRQHLYNLIYQRYRILENPTGSTITMKSLQRALTEVLGRPFNDDEMSQLQHSILNLPNNFELDTATFAGICAFSERVYGKYELEKRNECIICSKQRNVDKERCHAKRRSDMEDMDLSYIANKIRFGETNKSIFNLIQALFQNQ